MSDPKPQSEPTMEEILATVRRIIAEDESGAVSAPASASAPTGAPAPAAAPSSSGDVLELTEALEPDGKVRRIAPFAASPRLAGATVAAPLPDGRIEPAPPRSAAAEAAGAQQSRPAVAEAGDTEGVSKPQNEAAPAAAGRPLDEIARDLLRPMLQRWIDENLPGIVEREVRAALARSGVDADQRRAGRGKRTAARE